MLGRWAGSVVVLTLVGVRVADAQEARSPFVPSSIPPWESPAPPPPRDTGESAPRPPLRPPGFAPPVPAVSPAVPALEAAAPTAEAGFYLPTIRTVANRPAAERRRARENGVSTTPIYANPTMATASLGPAPDRPPFLPLLVPDSARALDPTTYWQKPAPGSRPPISQQIDAVNAWGGRLQESAESWTREVARAWPWGTTTR